MALICVMFGSFTICMLAEQISAIMAGTVQFSHASRNNDRADGLQRLCHVLDGPAFSLRWVLPLPYAKMRIISSEITGFNEAADPGSVV